MAEVFPRKIGKYVLLKPLARGGMGEIYVAATGEPGFQKFCVIKKVIAERTDRAKANRFLDEAKVVLRLSHANLVPTFDAGESDGEFYIAMELVEGKDLREIWNSCVRTRTRIPLDVALHVGREIARALAYVHTYGDLHLVHRDVAPPNILLSYFGEVKLTDFGLARSVLKQEHTAPGIVFGRASYLAPEQARGETADARSDIYSLGVVIWELLTGHQYLQLSNLDAATAMSLVRNPRPQPPSTRATWITSELDSVVMRALAPARDERYQSAEEMRQALADVIARLSPRADAERSADFLRGLYGDANRAEHAEREQLLAASAAAMAGLEAGPVRPPEDERAPGVVAPPSRKTPAPDGDEPTRLWRRSTDPGTQTRAAASVRTGGPADDAPRAGEPVSEPILGFDFTGRVIDNRYRILRQIGEGGMGTVYAGEHVEIGKGVALKILHPAYSRQQDLVERFRREARAASRIGHPNIVDVTDFGTTEEGCAYFVMEHLDGIDLADVLSHERRIEPGRACQIGIQICRALEAAHVAGVIHRDLKPENIFLVARDGQADFVKVLDFGIARSLGQTTRRLTNPGIAMGTPEYMSPEQALGGLADRRSDIYSVGALLYEMVTGAPPYGEGDQAVATRASKPPRSPRDRQPEVSLELSRIILRALEGRPDKRHQTMAQLEYDLTKSLWGRTRAVAELLGLPAAEARAEDSGGARQVGGDGRAAADGPSPAAPAPVAFSPSPARTGSTRAGGFGTLEPVGLDPTAGGSGTLRFVGSLAFLAAAAVVAVGAYKRLPWAGTGTSAAPQAAAAVAAPAPSTARTEAVTKQLELMLAAPLTFEQVPALEAALADLRGQGATAAAGSLAARSAVALERVAAAELDAGNIDRGVAHYKLALALDPRAQGQSQLVVTLRTRAEAALDRGRADESVRWARKAVSLAEADPEIHALLAAGLSAAHDEPGAAVEYGKALASRPHDPELAAALARVQRHLKRPPHAHRRMARRAPAPDETSAPQSEPAAPAAPADKDEADDAPALAPPPSSPTKAKESAPGEPASEQ